MDGLLHHLGTHDLSLPGKGFWLYVPQSLSSSLSVHLVPWIAHVSDFAQMGLLQTAIVAASLVWMTFWMTLWSTRPRIASPIPRPILKDPASSIQWPYELLSQAARASSLAFISIAFFKGRLHYSNLVAVAYALLLGLLRLTDGRLRWRQVALHQINYLLTALLFILSTAHLLPCIQVSAQCTTDLEIVGAVASLAVAAVVAVTTPRAWVPPDLETEAPGEVQVADREPAPEETCSWLNYYFTYSWLNPIIWKGTKHTLDVSDIPKLAWYDEPMFLLRKVQRARSISRTTFWTTLRFQRTELVLMALWIASSFIVENVAPYGMFNLLDYLANPAGATYHPWLWLILTFVGPMCRTMLFQQYVFTSTRLIVRIKSAMTQELYHKALHSMELEENPFEDDGKHGHGTGAGEKSPSSAAQKSTSSGRLANLMAADVDAIYRARDIVMCAVGLPAGTIISLIGLYRMMGWASLVGISVVFLATPISVWLAKMIYGAQRRVRKVQDGRISLVTEYLASIRAVKYLAWEDAVSEKIIRTRAAEQDELWQVAVLQTIVNQVTQAFPYIGLLVMFGLYIGVGRQPLDASTAFTAVFLVKNIRRNSMMASAFSRNFAAATVAFDRLDKYFERVIPLLRYPVGPLRIENASFRRNKKATFRLDSVSLDFIEGGLNVITGQSGSGKSTLLLAILGETHLEEGRVTAPDDIAYASQTAWLQNDTIQANILFQSPMERTRYDRVIEACGLQVDLREQPDSDMTVVGENGASLSGGQKARVALARALYSKSPLLLLDDIFSALDARTSAGVWKHCFCSDLLKGRTVVLVTQVPWISEQADLAISLDKGRVQSAVPNIGVVRTPIAIAQVLAGDAEGEEEDGAAAGLSTGTTVTPGEGISIVSDDLSGAAEDKNDAPSAKDIVNQEMKASGQTGRMTVFQYLGYFGHPGFVATCLLGLLLSNICFFGSGWWMSVWVEAYNFNAHVDTAYYLGIYAAFTLLELISFGIVIIGFEWGAWRAARKLHNDFIHAIMRVSLSWFKTIPVGRITNRFSGDMASIDGNLSPLVRQMLDAVMMLFFLIAAMSSIMPIFMLPALLTCAFGVVVGEMYTRTAVIIKRMASSAQSPVFSQFADTLAGLPVIRARRGMDETFGRELAAKLRVWSAASEANYNCNRWVVVRIDFATALVALLAGIIALFKVGVVGAGLVGFSLQNANGLSLTILMLVRSMNDLEVEMQSFNRVKEYVRLEGEEEKDEPFPSEGEYADDETRTIPKAWPSCGEIEFRNVTIRYDEKGPNILTNVNLKFNAGERVAVVGRTGSGKSTLVLSLLRFTHIVEGQILFDGIDITKIPRRRLRESLSMIPQEATLFNGTIRSNLDPTELVPEESLEKALDNCKGIASFNSGSSDGSALIADGEDDDDDDGAQKITLSTEVDARGENFSHGQRQVLSLCRALIRRSKLMLLDEATASMDYETDRGIQQVLRRELEDTGEERTLVTIAHRLRTIIDYDRVVVMGGGRVIECGSPRELYDARGDFYDMICHSGELEELREAVNVPDEDQPARGRER